MTEFLLKQATTGYHFTQRFTFAKKMLMDHLYIKKQNKQTVEPIYTEIRYRFEENVISGNTFFKGICFICLKIYKK